ncbi:NF038130 family PEP-CTERM protein [Dapis sp. BLCC M126]|uniref:NF038130 family PEP-CTERM protein n=1 Tax=Dapis sp. BLCC M126 TaxID=3400189 RepID=UPI003CF3A97C
MAGIVKKFLASASVVVGMSAVFSAPAMAAKFNVSGTDYDVFGTYDYDTYRYYNIDGQYDGYGWGIDDTTYKLSQTEINNLGGINSVNVIDQILAGNSSAPGANIELGASSEDGNSGIVELSFQSNNGQTVKISNDIEWTDDLSRNWFSGIWEQVQEATIESKKEAFAESYAMRFVESTSEPMYDYYKMDGEQFFDNNYRALYENYERGLSSILGLSSDAAFDALTSWNYMDDILGMGSDPNISYISEDAVNLTVGLAGHYNLADRVSEELAGQRGILAYLLEGVQASEVFALQIDGVEGTDYFWSNSATYSGLKNVEDRFSHNGNYEVSINKEDFGGGVLSEDVPEPSTVLGLMAIGGLVAATKRKSQK